MQANISLSRFLNAHLWITLVNTALRGIGLVSRFVLVVYLARFSNFETIGAYGLIYAAASMTPAVLCFGLHYRLNRHMIDAPPLEVGRLLRDRVLLHLMVFPVAAGIAGAIATQSELTAAVSPAVSAIIGAVCLGELLLNEIHLALISSRKPILANIVYFFRSAFWILPFIAVSYIVPAMLSVSSILGWWLIGQIMALITCAIGLRAWPWREVLRQRTDIRWLLREPRTSAMIYASDIGVNGSMYVDRFVMSAFLSVHDVGIYTFFWSLANGLQQLVFTAVVQIALPHLVSAARSSSDVGTMRQRLRAELARTAGAGVIFGTLVYAIAPVLDVLVGRDALASHGGLFLALIVAVLIRLMGDVTQYGLYARGKDRQFALINIGSAFISTTFSTVGLAWFGLSGIGPALILSAAIVLALRVHALHRDLI